MADMEKITNVWPDPECSRGVVAVSLILWRDFGSRSESKLAVAKIWGGRFVFANIRGALIRPEVNMGSKPKRSGVVIDYGPSIIVREEPAEAAKELETRMASHAEGE